MIGITRQSLWNKEQGISAWTLPELIRMKEIMQQNGIDELLAVSIDGILYRITIQKITEK